MLKGILRKKIQSRLFRWLPYAIIVFGLTLRLRQYLFNRSLTLDEAFLAPAIADGSLSGFFKPLEYSHVVPPGFTLMTKLSIFLFGNNDLIIRLFPFVAGTLSLVLFWKLAARIVSPAASLIALFLFSISGKLIFYSTVLKQYSVDVAATLIIFLTATKMREKEMSGLNAFNFAVTGAITVWFSHASVFVLAGAGLYFAVPKILKREWKHLSGLLMVYICWMISFAFLYWLTIKDFSGYTVHTWIEKFWCMKDSFMPISFSSGLWLYRTFEDMMLRVCGYTDSIFRLPALLMFLCGCIAMYMREKGIFYILILPVIFTIASSAFHVYPVYGRMILFFSPILFIMMAECAGKISLKSSFATFCIKLILVILLCYQPLCSALHYLKHPRVVHEIKPVLRYVKDHIKPHDIIYLYYWAEPAFRYYDEFYGFDYDDFVFISSEPAYKYEKEVDHFRRSKKNKNLRIEGYDQKYRRIIGIAEDVYNCENEINQLRGNKRVWFVFYFSKSCSNFVKYLDKIGSRLDSKKHRASSAYLYDLTGSN